jgi:predicted acylesterase/phospholipase RssA
MTIKILSLSGGGPNGIITLGIIQKLEEKGYLNINEINKIYATSVGAIVSVLLSLKFDWETINDYIIQRPWHETYKIKIEDILSSYTKKGIFDISSVETFYKPFFNASDLNISITMKELYEYSNIELHFFSHELNNYNTIDISYKTFPDTPVTQCILMSCAIPILFTPVTLNNKCYIDGGCECNYPIEFCLKENSDVNEILGIYNISETSEKIISEESNILEFIIFLFYKLISKRVIKEQNINLIPNEIIYKTNPLTFSFMSEVLFSSENRKELIEKGISIANDYLQNIKFSERNE